MTSFSRGDSSPDACSVCVLMGKDGDEISAGAAGWEPIRTGFLESPFPFVVLLSRLWSPAPRQSPIPTPVSSHGLALLLVPFPRIWIEGGADGTNT